MDMDSIRARLRDLNVSTQREETDRREPEIPVTAVGVQPNTRATNSREEILDRFHAQDFTIKILDRFKDLPNISNFTWNSVPVTYDFVDGEKINDPALILEHRSDEFLAGLGRKVFPMIASGFSASGVGALFVLAYNLKDPADNSPILLLPDEVRTEKDKPYDELSTEVSTERNRARFDLPAIRNNISGEAKAYSYLAASLLRLFTKPGASYVGAFDHIVREYSRFYRVAMPVSPPRPTTEAMMDLTYFFSNGDGDGLFKSTLYRILYCGGGSHKAQGLRSFLYEDHLAYAGLHAYSLFDKLCSELGSKPRVLIRVLWSVDKEYLYVARLECLARLIVLAERTDPSHRRKMWRYGRLFYEGFIAPLKMKTYPVLAFVLASALKIVAPQSNRNIMNIVHFANISPERKTECAAIAEALIKKITSSS